MLIKIRRAVRRALAALEPNTSGRRCMYCARAAQYWTRCENPRAPRWLQLLTDPTYYSCKQHRVAAMDAAISRRAVSR